MTVAPLDVVVAFQAEVTCSPLVEARVMVQPLMGAVELQLYAVGRPRPGSPRVGLVRWWWRCRRRLRRCICHCCPDPGSGRWWLPPPSGLDSSALPRSERPPTRIATHDGSFDAYPPQPGLRCSAVAHRTALDAPSSIVNFPGVKLSVSSCCVFSGTLPSATEVPGSGQSSHTTPSDPLWGAAGRWAHCICGRVDCGTPAP